MMAEYDPVGRCEGGKMGLSLVILRVNRYKMPTINES